ncbi:9394_t:CDS:2, partial [Cetraspora pellucida]
MHSKTSIQQKWESIYQKYQNIKDEFFDDVDTYMKNDPSITPSITSDSIHEIKHSKPDNTSDNDND